MPDRPLVVVKRVVVRELNEVAFAEGIQEEHEFARRKGTRGHAAIMRPYNGQQVSAVGRAFPARAGWAVLPRRVRLQHIVEALPVVAAVLSLIGFAFAAYFRVTFAYPMWVMETPTMQAIRRILAGQPLYAPPTLAYVAPIYAPLYFWVSAILARVIGVSLVAPRLVSLFASLGCAALIASMVWSETRRGWLAVVTAGLFISTTALSSFALDLARVDPLCLLFLLGAIACLRAADNRLWLAVASGVLVGLAVFTKQTAIALALPLVLIPILDRRSGASVAYVVGLGVVLLVGGLLLYAAYGRWAQFFLLTLPSRHSLSTAEMGVFWTQKILPGATVLLLVAPVFFISRWAQRDFKAVRFWFLVGAGMFGMSWVATMNRWSDNNVLLPASAALVILAGLGFDALLNRLSERSPFRSYAFVLLALEFAIVAYNPRWSSPLRSDVQGEDRLVSAMAGLNGPVFAPDFPELSYQAGKGDAAFGIGLLELTGGFGGKPTPESSQWIADYRAALDRREYAVLLFDPEGVEPFLTDEAQAGGYVDTGPLFKSNDVFWSLGSRYAPKVHVWLPKEQVKPGS